MASINGIQEGAVLCHISSMHNKTIFKAICCAGYEYSKNSSTVYLDIVSYRIWL